MARPTGPKPLELLQLHTPAAELFAALGQRFEVPAEHEIDLRDVHVAIETLASTREIAAMAMRYTQFVRQAAAPGVTIGSEVVVAVVHDLNLLLGRLAHEADPETDCREVIENARELLSKAAYAVIAVQGPDPVNLT